MKFTYLYLVLGLLGGGAFSEALAAPYAGPATAAISKIDGDGLAKVRRKSGIETVAGVKQELFSGDRITTDARSTVEIILADGTLVRVGLNSEYRLDSVEKKSGIFSWVFGLAKGSIRALVEKNPNKNMVKFRVNTPVGTMGVRGTELVLDHDEKAKVTTLYTIEGSVEFGPKNCFLNKKCIEVKAGETSSVGENSSEKPVAKITEAYALFLLNEHQTGTGVGNSSMDAASKGAKISRAALFQDIKKAEAFVEKASGSIDAVSKGDIDEMVKSASEAMADAQDKLIGRTKEQREKIHNAIDDGSYRNRLKLAEKFDDAVSKKTESPKEREEENFSAAKVAKKMDLAEAILKSKKMKKALAKRAALADSDLLEKMKDAGKRLKEAKDNSNNPAVSADTSVSSATETNTSADAGADTGANTYNHTDEAPEEVEAAVEEMNKEMADGIISDQFRFIVLKEYSYLTRVCAYICMDVTVNGLASLEQEYTRVERKSGVCYETKKNCKRDMIPCDLSQGKFCKPTFTPYQCTETKVQVACPASTSTNTGL